MLAEEEDVQDRPVIRLEVGLPTEQLVAVFPTFFLVPKLYVWEQSDQRSPSDVKCVPPFGERMKQHLESLGIKLDVKDPSPKFSSKPPLEYGQIHVVIKEMIEHRFGEKTWARILDSSGMDENVDFFVFSIYDDALTFRLFDSASSVLNVPRDAILREYGTYFLSYCLKHGYDKMLLTLGQDIFSFVQNLDSLHSMLSLSYPGIVSPSFRCQEHDDGTMTLHHYSWREGMYPIVQGMVEGMGKELFNQIVTVTLTRTSKEEVDSGKFRFHSSMEVEIKSRGRGEGLVTGKHMLTTAKLKRRKTSVDMKKHDDGTRVIASVEDLTRAFPYHILMNEELHILQCGEKIRQLLSFPVTSSTTFNDIAIIRQPVMSATADHITSFINSVFFIDFDPQHEECFQLKGQMMFLPGSGTLLFMGSPRLYSLNELKDKHLYQADIPLYDVTRELVLLNQQRFAEIDVARKLDQATIALKQTSKDLENEKHKTEDLLHNVMPTKVARQLQELGYVNAEKHEWSTVLFTNIVTFTDITTSCDADQVISMLNDMYSRFDIHVDIHDVYKVETIGDAYMAVAGVPEEQEDHAERMAEFAMDMVEEAVHVTSPLTGLPLQMQVGMHSGSVVSGVIGMKKPRYDIYGDTVNTASRMTSHSVPGRIHVSFTTFEKLFFSGYIFKSRGEITVKGKGKMNTHFLIGSMNRDVVQPDDEFTSMPDVFDPKIETDTKLKDLERTLSMSMASFSTRSYMHTTSTLASGSYRFANSFSRTDVYGKRASFAVHDSYPVQSWRTTPSAVTASGLSSKHSMVWRMPNKTPNVPSLRNAHIAKKSSRMGHVPEHHTETWNLSPPPPSAVSVRAWPALGTLLNNNTNPNKSHSYLEYDLQSACDRQAGAITFHTEASEVLPTAYSRQRDVEAERLEKMNVKPYSYVQTESLDKTKPKPSPRFTSLQRLSSFMSIISKPHPKDRNSSSIDRDIDISQPQRPLKKSCVLC